MVQVTGISNSEEEAMGRADLVPFLLEDRIREVHMHLSSAHDIIMSCAFSAGCPEPHLYTSGPALLYLKCPCMQ